MAAGVVRLGLQAPIREFYYDFEEERIGPVHFKMPYIFVTPSTPGGVFTTHRLYKEILKDPTAVACIVVNNLLMVVVREGSFYSYSPEGYVKGETENAGFLETTLDFKAVHRVGWVRTQPKSKTADVKPYFLYSDKDGRVTFDYVNTMKPLGITTCTEFSYYKEMLAQGKNFMYMTSRGPVYL